MVNYNTMASELFDKDIDRNYFAIFCLILFSFLCFVRKIEVFAATHLFADAMIMLAIIIIVSFGGIKISNDGLKNDVDFINQRTFADAIGFSVYAFEGIGMILPVQEITANPAGYKSIVIGVIITICAVYVSFGYFCVIAWG
jgi:solute carrier family 36 (proton-coupled amino acid transporter)